VEAVTAIEIRQAQAGDADEVRSLFAEYLGWANATLIDEYGIDLHVHEAVDRDMAGLAIFSPPPGRLLLVTRGGDTVAIGCLKRSAQGVCEIKRMYVRPPHRRVGVGRALLNALLEAARDAGYDTVRLDSARFMHAAHALYRSAGFVERDPYPESEIPKRYWQHWRFMEKPLREQPGERQDDPKGEQT
jgi:GNAT superfamily N-acetyltransferase